MLGLKFLGVHTQLGVTGSNFEMKPERRRMPGFGLHFEVRAGHAEWSVREGGFFTVAQWCFWPAGEATVRSVASRRVVGTSGVSLVSETKFDH